MATVQQTGKWLEAELKLDERDVPRCGRCEGRALCRDTCSARRFQQVPLWGIDVHLIYVPRRVVCEHCGGVGAGLLPWVPGKRQFTRALMANLPLPQTMHTFA